MGPGRDSLPGGGPLERQHPIKVKAEPEDFKGVRRRALASRTWRSGAEWQEAGERLRSNCGLGCSCCCAAPTWGRRQAGPALFEDLVRCWTGRLRERLGGGFIAGDEVGSGESVPHGARC
ncbi:hypothetical protein NDU88_006517 [Pleurodeles waltl]|uniref:Uncharacterized protein n=1 Tax=Pleurodeles waltl TaxID=8319 RepID=A0AAV7N7G7_PLEWA|nr:hypothetical protein NDU88_006517 [Pleurodeles waltl]